MKYSLIIMKIIITLCFWITFAAYAFAENIYDAIGRNAQISKFKEWVNNDNVLKVYLENRVCTVFAPTNDAISKFPLIVKPEISRKIASFHVAGVAAKYEVFPTRMSSSLQEAAPLYLGIREHRPPKHTHEYYHQHPKKDYYVNNAKIIETFEYNTKDGDKQILYIIDEVLDPYIPTSLLPPDALEYIRRPSIYGSDESLGSFYSKVEQAKQEMLYDKVGNHTFFVPVGDISRPGESFDQYVIRGHIIPNNVLFLRVMGRDNYPSAAFDDIVNVELSLFNRTIRIDTEQSYFVQSNTMKSRDPKHNKGVVMSRIVKANIPVKNGVVHLIEKPLMIIDSSLIDFLNLEANGRLSQFNRLLTYAPEIRAEITRYDQKTILAPTDTAFENLREGPNDDKVNQLIKNPNELKELLRLHIVLQSVSTDDIRSGLKPEVLSSDNRRTLYFRVVGDDKNVKLTVEGGGVNATAVQADIGATNGIIHIIDRVLGMPFQNVYDKLSSDPDLTFTHQLGLSGNQDWNKQMEKDDRRFTYFAPSNQAWSDFERENPSEYKQLKNGLYPYQTRKILERHLVVGKHISSAELESMDTIYTVQGALKVERGYGSYGPGNLIIEWEGKKAKIVRPDVQAINGVIHVIDTVLMKRRDLSVNDASRSSAHAALLIIALLITVLHN